MLGDGGRMPGRFNALGSVAVDSRGNLYTGETFEGKRVQKFTPKVIAIKIGGRSCSKAPQMRRRSGVDGADRRVRRALVALVSPQAR